MFTSHCFYGDSRGSFNKNLRSHLKIGSKFRPNLVQIGSKLGPSWVQVGSKLGLNWVQIGSKLGLNWVQIVSKLVPMMSFFVISVSAIRLDSSLKNKQNT